MALSQIAVTEGSGKNVASYSVSETTTKEVVRQALNNSSGVEIGTSSNPIRVDPTGTTTQPVSVTGTAAVSIATNTPTLLPGTTGGLTTFHLVSAASTNATNLKASAGQVFGWYIYNSNAAARKVTFHNTAGTPTAGASVFFSLVIPPSAGANVFSDIGIPFSTGIAITTVTGLADSDSTGVALNDLVMNIYYK